MENSDELGPTTSLLDKYENHQNGKHSGVANEPSDKELKVRKTKVYRFFMKLHMLSVQFLVLGISYCCGKTSWFLVVIL